MLRWIFALAIVCGAIYLAATVSFGGKTLMDRLLDAVDLSDCDDPGQRAAKPERNKLLTPKEKGTDQLTDQDRAKLDNLIESKLTEQNAGEASKARR